MPATPEQCRLYRQRHPEKERAYRAEYRRRHPGRLKAKNAVSTAVRNGSLVRLPCQWCHSTTNIEAHHNDYSRPLDVVWLCKPCHRKFHRLLKEASHEEDLLKMRKRKELTLLLEMVHW